jgi:renalase
MEKYPIKVAIIGAGLSSLSLLCTLPPASSLSVHLFERSGVLGGRAATRKRGKYLFDNGANYFNADHEKVRRLIFEELTTEGLIEIEKWIFPFYKDNRIDLNKERVSLW